MTGCWQHFNINESSLLFFSFSQDTENCFQTLWYCYHHQPSKKQQQQQTLNSQVIKTEREKMCNKKVLQMQLESS